MPLFIKAQLGDQLKLTDSETGAVTIIEIDRTRTRTVRLSLDAPQHIRIDRVPLDDRIKDADMDALFNGEDDLVEDESAPGSEASA